jgi:hypothetical protein
MKQAIPDEILDQVDRRRLALDAEVDIATLERALRGERIRPSTRHRIRRTLAARGLSELLPEGAK